MPEDICRAAEEGDAKEVRGLAVEGLNAAADDCNGWTRLQIASEVARVPRVAGAAQAASAMPGLAEVLVGASSAQTGAHDQSLQVGAQVHGQADAERERRVASSPPSSQPSRVSESPGLADVRPMTRPTPEFQL